MKKLFFALIGLAFFSCEKSFTPDFTMEETINLENFTADVNSLPEAKPDQPGGNMKVYRYESTLGFWLIDDKTSIAAWVNIDVPAACVGDRVRDLVDVQEILIDEKDGTSRSIVLLKGENVKVTVYNYSGNVCDILLQETPLLESRGDFIFRDNDFNPDGPNKNAYGLTFKGDGISISWHGVFDVEDGTVKQKTRINLKD